MKRLALAFGMLAAMRLAAADGTPAVAEAADAPAAMVLDLELAQRRALAQSPTLAAVAEQVAQAEARIKQARSLYFPQVTSEYTYSRTQLSNEQSENLDEALDDVTGLLGTAGLYLANPANPVSGAQALRLQSRLFDVYELLDDAREELDGSIERSQLTVTAGWLVFDGFARKHRNAMARYGAEETRAASLEAERLMLDAVARAYYGVQLARENVAVSQANTDFNQGLLNDAEARLEAGKGSYSDVLNFRVALRGARTALLRAQSETRAAETALATLMAEPGAMLPEHLGVPPLPPETPEDLQPPDADALIAFALDHRPDVAQGERRAARMEASRKARAASFAPQVSVFGQMQSRGINDSGIDPDRFSPTVGVNVTYDLYTGGRRRAEVLEARHAEREAELKLDEAELNVVSEVRLAVQEVVAAQELLVLQRLSAGDVQENRDLLAKAYDAGKAPLALLNQAQRDLAATQAQTALALASLRLAQEELKTATGARVGAMEAAPLE
jgi:outer membrane protein TolC